MNSVFRIVFGDYELALDRKTLAYDLTETKTGTKWGVGLSVGWIEVEGRESGEIVRHDFGDCKLISLSEKMSGQGKRLLLGLDTPEGLPVDVYFTCAEKEIQLTVEASRDSKTHTLHAIGLLPGLCSVPDDGKSHFVLPLGEGAMVFPSEIHAERTFPLWEAQSGLTMPFLGAVRLSPSASESCPLTPNFASALCLITDSAYASARLSKTSCDWEYARDPERRRLEIRLVLIPGGDHVAIARAYRDKLVGERAHVTLRKKIRERPEVQQAITDSYYLSTPDEYRRTLRKFQALKSVSGRNENRWDLIENACQKFEAADGVRFGLLLGDWEAPFVDAWGISIFKILGQIIPLTSVVHRDAVMPVFELGDGRKLSLFQEHLLDIFLRLARPGEIYDCCVCADCRLGLRLLLKAREVSQELYSLTFAAFLKEHRFLTEDFTVQEAVYTDKTRVVVNFSEENAYETDEFSLPPLGFYVNNSQMVLHDASRVGGAVFPERAWRVLRKSEAGEWMQEEFPLGENLRGPI